MNLLQRWAEKVTPEPFREFIPYVSPSALKVVHTTAVIKKSIAISQNYLSREKLTASTEALRLSISKHPIQGRIRVVSKIARPVKTVDLSPADRIEVGDRLLELYFHLIFHAPVIFLDLRVCHFEWDSQTRMLQFCPAPLRFEPEPEFREKLAALYRGFYYGDSAATQLGIVLYRWESTPTPGYDERVEKGLRDHFGDGVKGSISFSIDHFRKTFHQIFEEAHKSGAKFHPELSFIGTLLVTLYLSLEALGSKHVVRTAYERALQ